MSLTSTSFAQNLPQDFYYPQLAKEVLDKLSLYENVLVGGIYGCGIHTFLDCFTALAQQSPAFNSISILESTKPISSIKKTTGISGKKLVVIHTFEQIAHPNNYLEKLHRLRLPDPSLLTYLVISDHTVVTRPSQYFATTTAFFNYRFLVTPFDPALTHRMIEIDTQFFGWKVPKDLIDQIYTLSGGVQRLTKHICKLTHKNQSSIPSTEKILADPSIGFQLKMLTNILCQSPSPALHTLGITDHKGQIKSKLLQTYIQDHFRTDVANYFPTLSALEGNLFALLYQNLDSLITLDRIGDVMELLGHDFSPWAIYKLISRLKLKIAPQFTIKSFKSRGYLLSKALH
ncbi:hypothetical protein A2634_01935 [Candidatus Amesbacteria bacterium RIFCSPHIGHO2_01_FULL_48_32]|uniref:OmpR/PhoB-type domain-containing protein n=1 Tax=Candidatus Amesbacteria bacterium RIFCSPLOWO2_01_FULL_48_25 TaxID=1797259 RepID=A0A1F4ZDD1_9BACT|nr:MAG: hypothetical protein A2634_01935 [Candidatus Amesbacteria bacterium RIFCSPHIGHO2_01_FULL_48_32]OGD04350.1 MAG: hypothetical protein A2989_04935 [Candidatus Amesbacteria bacterium RIFCSPLOWO2_01_FULL_48_25]